MFKMRMLVDTFVQPPVHLERLEITQFYMSQVSYVLCSSESSLALSINTYSVHISDCTRLHQSIFFSKTAFFF